MFTDVSEERKFPSSGYKIEMYSSEKTAILFQTTGSDVTKDVNLYGK
jgi:hypothetical protein